MTEAIAARIANEPARWGSAGALAAALQREREHWFVFFPVLFGVGAGSYFALPFEPPLVASWLPFALIVVLWRGTRDLVAIMAAAGVIAGAGFGLAKLRTEWVRAPVLEKRIGPVEVRGYVRLVEPRVSRGQRITLDVTSIAGLPQAQTPQRVRIRAMQPLAGVKAGEGIVVKATLAPPAGPALPAGYDFARTAWFQALGGVGYSLTAPQRDVSAAPPPRNLALTATIERARQAIGARILASIPGESGAIANALITGERGGISEATNDAYRDAGLFHILSISGLHMVIMAGAVFYFVRLLLATVPVLALNYPIKKWAAVAAAIAALAYLLISGSAFATVRSYIMISVMFLAVLLDRPALAMRNVALAALIILVLFPESLLDVGFQMSFAAVVALVASYEYLSERNRSGAATWRRTLVGRTLMFFGGIVLSTIVAGVAVAPFAAYHFHTSQQFAVLANLITIPICNLIVMPAALAALILMPFGLEWAALWIMGKGIDAMTSCAKWAAAIPGAVGHVRAMPSAAFLLMVLGGLWFTLWRTRWRTLGVAGVAAGLALLPLHARPDLLVGRDGALVALRNGAHDRLVPVMQRSANFELKRWLEADGDPREVKAALSEGKQLAGLQCDDIGCTSKLKGQTVALSRHPAALADDCARANILVLDIPRPRACERPGTVVDFYALRRLGTHALYIDGESVRVETVAQHRGNRPWSRLKPLPQPRVAVRKGKEEDGALKSAADGELRPETEGDDDPRYDQE